MSAHDFSFAAIGGKKLALSQYAGQPVLIVNTASQCGLTPQYEGLQALWDRYHSRGFTVLGVPSNDFGGQEPGTEAEIKSFCTANYNITFPMTSKNAVLGPDAHPFYRWVIDEAGEAAAPKWNFHKYLIGVDGSLKGSFGSKTAPDDSELIAAIEAELPGN